LTGDLDRVLRRRRLAHRLVRIAAVVVVLVTAAVLASNVHDRFRQAEDRFLAFTQQATEAHVLFAGTKPAADAGEIGEPGDETTVVSWLSQRLTGVPVRAPDLRSLGYELAVERILPSANGPAAQLMYESGNADQPVTLFIGKSRDKMQTAFTFVKNEDLSIFYWQEGPFAYSLAGNLDKFDLLALAEEVNAQLVALPPMPKSLVQRRATEVTHAAGKTPLAAVPGSEMKSVPGAAPDTGAGPQGVLVHPISKALDRSEPGDTSGRDKKNVPAPVKESTGGKKAPVPSVLPVPASESEPAKKT
jgi:anti-sigma factor RsiW